MRDNAEMPECRYCGNKSHTSQEFEACILKGNGTSVKPPGATQVSDSGELIAPLNLIGNMRVRDCSVTDLIAYIHACSPFGFIFSRPIKEVPESGTDVDTFLAGPPELGIKLAQFLTGYCREVLKKKAQQSGGASHEFKSRKKDRNQD